MYNKYLEKLEYHVIKEKLISFCKTFNGRFLASRLEPYIDKDIVQSKLDETNIMIDLINSFGNIPISQIEDLSPIFKRIESGMSLSSSALLQIANLLSTSKELLDYYNNATKERPDTYELIQNSFLDLYINESIEKKIKNAIISENEISDTASPTLNKIRKDKKNLEIDIRNKLNDIIHSNTYSKYIQDKVVTIRNGRFVIPVMNEYRGIIKGFIHDISSSGQTVYIEPLSVFEINNKINELEINEVNEIEKILDELSGLLYPIYSHLKNNIELISMLDFLNSKAILSEELEATKPILSNYIYLKKARHPMLDKSKVVPITLYLGKVDETKSNFTTLVIRP